MPEIGPRARAGALLAPVAGEAEQQRHRSAPSGRRGSTCPSSSR